MSGGFFPHFAGHWPALQPQSSCQLSALSHQLQQSPFSFQPFADGWLL